MVSDLWLFFNTFSILTEVLTIAIAIVSIAMTIESNKEKTPLTKTIPKLKQRDDDEQLLLEKQ